MNHHDTSVYQTIKRCRVFTSVSLVHQMLKFVKKHGSYSPKYKIKWHVFYGPQSRICRSAQIRWTLYSPYGDLEVREGEHGGLPVDVEVFRIDGAETTLPAWSKLTLLGVGELTVVFVAVTASFSRLPAMSEQ